MFDKILLPTDGSDVAFAAAGRAVALAKLAGAALHVVFVREPYPYTGIGATNSAGCRSTSPPRSAKPPKRSIASAGWRRCRA